MTARDGSSGVAAGRARLAELDAALARLRGQYELLMNAFRFEAAKALVPRIEAAERQRAALAASLPPGPPEPAPAPFTVARRRRR